jgi:predicted DNA-binding transcriptional regulator YafY
MERFEQSERNVYRDLDELEYAGYVLDRQDGKYKLILDNSTSSQFKNLFHFTEEEAAILFETLEHLEGSSNTKSRLLRKMDVFYDLKILESLKDKDDLIKIQMIKKSIQQKRQIKLLAYQSSNSSTIQDRTIEAFYFSPNYRFVWGYEPHSNMCKQFKISRIESIQITGFYWEQESKHQKPFVDIFRMSSKQPIDTVVLELSLRAYNSLKEEYTLPSEYVVKIEDNKYLLSIPIAHFKGISRFVMGLLDEITIIETPQFKNHIQNQLRKHLKNYSD